MNKKKDFITDFLQNGIIAVCENFEEAEYSRQNGASGILLVKERGGDENDVFVMPNEDFIRNVVENIDIPILVRIKFGHFGEAKICEELGVDGLLEAFQTENSLEKKLDKKEFDLPIISEIFDVEKIPDANKNILILGDYATGNFFSIKEKFSEYEKNFLEKNEKLTDKNIFLGGGISSVADICVLQEIGKIHGFFVGSAIFENNEREFFEDYWDYKKNIF